MISLITTFCTCVDKLPLPSSYVHVTVVFDEIGKLALCVPEIIPMQLSDAVGAVRLVISHSDVKSDKLATSGTGAVTSRIVTT